MASRQLIQSLAHFVVAIVELEEETINIDCEPDLILANHYAEITKLI